MKLNLELEDTVAALLEKVNNFDPVHVSDTNLIDPFAATLEAALFEIANYEDWLLTEQQRTKQKNLMNHIGNLQQEIIGKLSDWNAYQTGTGMPDIVGIRGNQKILGEVKNKHNTMNSNSSIETYNVLARFLEKEEFNDFTAIVVTVISPTRRANNFKKFSPGQSNPREDIVIMSGRVFYAFATDAECRVPFRDVDPSEDMSRWPSWTSIDFMVEAFWKEITRQTGFEIPIWVKDLTSQALS